LEKLLPFFLFFNALLCHVLFCAVPLGNALVFFPFKQIKAGEGFRYKCLSDRTQPLFDTIDLIKQQPFPFFLIGDVVRELEPLISGGLVRGALQVGLGFSFVSSVFALHERLLFFRDAAMAVFLHLRILCGDRS
jgi:hypothetical protein